MSLFKKAPHTLAIVGNGFDMNHGYKTDYKSFAQCSNDPCLQTFEKYCETEDIDTWYFFEENIGILSEKLFQKSIAEYCDFDDNRKEVQELTETFIRIHDALKNYLKNTTSSFPLVKNPNIEKYLNRGTMVFNFNYTETVEAYADNIIYVHGSLREDDIILGYDYRNSACLEQFEDMQWSKDYCRESLAFRRFLLRNKKYKLNDKKYNELISSLQKYHQGESSGRGLDDEVIKGIPKFRIIDKFLRRYRAKFYVPNINYTKIETIAILGHGIEADRVFLKMILEKCVNLSKVVIYRYDGEDDNSYNAKVSFFTPYCNNIEEAIY